MALQKPAADASGPFERRKTSGGSLFNRYATPFTTGLFLVSLVSGVALFFHWQQGAFHAMHEWLSMVLLVPFFLHVWKNWTPLVGYFKRGTLVIPLVLCVIAALPFAYQALSAGPGGGRAGNPAFRAATVLVRAPLADLAPLFKTTPDALIATLRDKGYQAQSPDDTLDALATAAGKQPTDALGAILPPPGRPARG